MNKSEEKKYSKWHSQVKAGSKTTLAIVDMQKLFLTEKKSPWAEPKQLSIIPNIKKLIDAVGKDNVVFTRFIPPKTWTNQYGSWKTYYQINKKITRDHLGTDALEIIDDLLPYILNKSVVSDRNKSASVFTTGSFHSKIKNKSTKFLIFAGIETDYCILASVLDAIHMGYYVIVVMDACSSSKKYGQKHALGIFERFPEQLWITSTKNLIKQISKTSPG